MLEFIVNGELVKTRRLQPSLFAGKNITGKTVRERIEIPASGWMAVRCWENPEGEKARFAHTAPWWFDLGGGIARPRRHEVEWFADRVREEIARNRPVLSAVQLLEYEEALAFYEGLLRDAR